MSSITQAFGKELVVPEAWREVLRAVQGYFPEAIIAGGALRDLWHDKPAKDVDIFIPMNALHVPGDAFETEMRTLCEYPVKIAACYYGQVGHVATPGFRNIFVIWSLSIGGVIYELIFIEETAGDIIDVFDLSIAQIAYDGVEGRVSEKFKQTIKDKVIRVCNVNRADRQTKRLARVLERYPEYTAEPPKQLNLTDPEGRRIC